MGPEFNQNTELKKKIYLSSTYSFRSLLLLKSSEIEQNASERYKLCNN